MYIDSPAWPSPGIEPRMPNDPVWSGGAHTSTVAHSSGEVSSGGAWAAVFLAPAGAAARPASTAQHNAPAAAA